MTPQMKPATKTKLPPKTSLTPFIMGTITFINSINQHYLSQLQLKWKDQEN